jgi:hypothetical protein
MIHEVNLVGSVVVDLMVNLGVGMDPGMLDTGVHSHDLGARREADDARGDSHFQTIPSVGA